MAGKSKSTVNVPESRQALDNMKYEIAKQLGVNMTKGYNGNLTARENGYVGGYMVKNITTVRLPKKISFERTNRVVDGHKITVRYIAEISI